MCSNEACMLTCLLCIKHWKLNTSGRRHFWRNNQILLSSAFVCVRPVFGWGQWVGSSGPGNTEIRPGVPVRRKQHTKHEWATYIKNTCQMVKHFRNIEEMPAYLTICTTVVLFWTWFKPLKLFSQNCICYTQWIQFLHENSSTMTKNIDFDPFDITKLEMGLESISKLL